MDEMKTTSNQLYCTHCGCAVEEDEFNTVGEDILCPECAANYCCTCERCGMLMYDDDAYSDEYHCLCESCFGNHYIHCEHCGRIVHNDDAYEYDGSFYCPECYSRKTDIIHEYSYKPEPVFYGKGSRFFGVELEIDIGGRDNDNADSVTADIRL